MRLRFRHSVRGLILDERDHLLLYRFTVPSSGLTVWTPPGGGVEEGESRLEALARELDEEVGLQLPDGPPHVWHQEAAGTDLVPGYDGVVNDYYLVRTSHFTPRGSLGADELARELVANFRWWPLEELRDHRGDAVFGPRDLPALMARLMRATPDRVVAIGL